MSCGLSKQAHFHAANEMARLCLVSLVRSRPFLVQSRPVSSSPAGNPGTHTGPSKERVLQCAAPTDCSALRSVLEATGWSGIRSAI